jgi:hypothetical protein
MDADVLFSVARTSPGAVRMFSTVMVGPACADNKPINIGNTVIASSGT